MRRNRRGKGSHRFAKLLPGRNVVKSEGEFMTVRAKILAKEEAMVRENGGARCKFRRRE